MCAAQPAGTAGRRPVRRRSVCLRVAAQMQGKAALKLVSRNTTAEALLAPTISAFQLVLARWRDYIKQTMCEFHSLWRYARSIWGRSGPLLPHLVRLARPEAPWALLKLAVTRLAYAALPVCYCMCAIKDVAGKSFWRLEIHGLMRQLTTAANSCEASSAVDRRFRRKASALRTRECHEAIRIARRWKTLLSARMSHNFGPCAMGQTVSARYRRTFNTHRTLAASHWQIRTAVTVWCARLQAARQESTAAHPEFQFVGAGPEHAAAKPCITAQAGMSSPLVRNQHRARRTSHQVSTFHRPRPPLNACLPQNIPNRKHRCCRCWSVSLACR